MKRSPSSKALSNAPPGYEASDGGWRAPASSAGTPAPWFSAAPAAAAWCSPPRPSEWFPYSSACLWGIQETRIYSQSQLTSWPEQHSILLFFYFFYFSVHYEQFKDSGMCEMGERWWWGGGYEEEADERTVTVDHTLTDHLTWVSRFPALWSGHWCWTSVCVQLREFTQETFWVNSKQEGKQYLSILNVFFLWC